VTDKTPRSHIHRRARSRGRLRALVLVVPTAAAVAVAGVALGLPAPGLDAALESAGGPARHDTPVAVKPHDSPATSPSAVPPAQPESSGPTLSTAPRPAASSAILTSSPSSPSSPSKTSRATSPSTVSSAAAVSQAVAKAPARQQSVATRKAAPNQPAATFRVASFNTLGASHTGPRSQRPRFATGATRTPWAVQLLDNADITVAGLQEFQPPQIHVFNRVATGWRAWPGLGSRAGVNSLAWRTSTWRPVETHTLDIPYFGGRPVPMPYVLLRHVATGQRVWFANFHNPADAHGPAQRWRDEAVRREVALVNKLHADGTPVVVTGDFNDRDAFFCPFARGAGVTSADGSRLTSTGCRLAPQPGVDWIVGTRDTHFADFHRLRRDLVARTSDHPFVWTRATVH
jgi:endonuclease/exonuclease/phosphatase family protein